MSKLITGIQQVGIGVADSNEAKYYYKDVFGMNVLVFDDTSSADLMTKYTGDKVHQRRAILTMNLCGGGGFELWQFLSRQPSTFQAAYGDIGIFGVKIKCFDIHIAYDHFKNKKNIECSSLMTSPGGSDYFWIKDVYGNFFDIAASDCWFKKNDSPNGGVYGAVIGVSDMNASLQFYQNVLGLTEVIYDNTSAYSDLPSPSNDIFRRILLRKSKASCGAFSNLLGHIEIELVQNLSQHAKQIFEKRYWGDCGFIHLCFDVTDMNALKELSEKLGYKFTVDSKNSYAMDTAEGRFCYVEDPDGTLIELVETHRIPIIKKWNWQIDLKKRKGSKPLPGWMINMLGLNKVK